MGLCDCRLVQLNLKLISFYTCFPKKFQASYSHSLKISIKCNICWFAYWCSVYFWCLIAIYTESNRQLALRVGSRPMLWAFALFFNSLFLSKCHEFPVSSFLPYFLTLPPSSPGLRQTGFSLLSFGDKGCHSRGWTSQLQKSSAAFCLSDIKCCPAQVSMPRRKYIVLASTFYLHGIWKQCSCFWVSSWVQTVGVTPPFPLLLST